MTDRILSTPRNIQDILGRLTGKEDWNNYWTADCPVHGHKTPKRHLTIKDAGDKALVTCQGNHGHDYKQICQALGFDSLTYSHSGGRPGTLEKRLVQTFSYQDIDNKEVYQVRRYEPKDFKVLHMENGEYVPGLGKRKPILYKLPKLREWIQQGKTVYIPEGERKVDKLIEIGLAATTAPFGASKGKWHADYSQSLVGADVVILPDNDDVGKSYGEEKANSLQGVAKRVRVLLLPDLPPAGDIVDWLDNGGTKEELEKLTDKAPEWRPKTTAQDLGGIRVVSMADVQTESVSWLWKPYIPQGKVTLLEGDPGVGKSWLSLAIATAVSLGKGLPGQEHTEPAQVVLASAEDGLGDTIRPRLDAMGADVNRVLAIDGLFTLDDNGLTMLETTITRYKPALLIIDPLVAYLGSGVDMYRGNETRPIMAKLAALAERYFIAILAVRHLTKSGMAKSIYRGLGSIDFTASCRSILLAGCDPDNDQKRGLVHEKSNLAPKGNAVGYELRDGGFYWVKDCDLTVSKILAAEGMEETSALGQAEDFLQEELGDGPVDASQVLRDARESGLSEKTVRRAKAKLGIKSQRQGEEGKKGGGKFAWELPGAGGLEGQKDLHGQVSVYGYLGHVNENRLKNGPDSKEVGHLNPHPQDSQGQGDLGGQVDTPNPDLASEETQATDRHEAIPDMPEYPISYCPVCRSGDYWLRQASQWGPATWVCSRCHPQPGQQ